MKFEIKRENVTSLRNSKYVGISRDYKVTYAGLNEIEFVVDIDNSFLSSYFLMYAQSTEKYDVSWRDGVRRDFDGCQLYRFVTEIRLAGAPIYHPPLLSVYCAPNNLRSGNLRMKISPQHYSAKEISDLFEWLGHEDYIGKDLCLGLGSAWITNIHYALDIVGMGLNDYFIGLDGARKGALDLLSEGDVLTLGASALKASIHEMVDVQRLSTDELYGHDLLMLGQDQFRRFLRIGLRLTLDKQKLMLSNLLQMENIVSRLRFYDRCALDDQDLEPDFAKLLCHSSYPTARSEFMPANKINGRSVNPDKKLAKNRVDNVMKKYCIDVFDTDVLWAQLPKVAEQLGILAQPQYWLTFGSNY